MKGLEPKWCCMEINGSENKYREDRHVSGLGKGHGAEETPVSDTETCAVGDRSFGSGCSLSLKRQTCFRPWQGSWR